MFIKIIPFAVAIATLTPETAAAARMYFKAKPAAQESSSEWRTHLIEEYQRAVQRQNQSQH